jgi:hypothetical protein
VRPDLAELGCGTGPEQRLGQREVCSFLFFSNSNTFFKNKQTILNSNQVLNPNTQKQCTSMNATVNAYVSLIN